MTIKCLMFDLCGTLMDNRPALINADNKFNLPLWRKRGYTGTDESFKKIKKDIENTIDKLDRVGKNTRDSLTKHLSERLKIPVSDEDCIKDFYDFYDYYRDEVKLFEHTSEILAEFKKHGIILILISNGWDEINNRNMESLDIKKYFDYIINSDKFGARKSDLLPFEHALKKFDLKGEECLMIGDDLIEDASAKKFNIKFVFFNNNKKYIKKPKNADFMINKLIELPDIVKQF